MSYNFWGQWSPTRAVDHKSKIQATKTRTAWIRKPTRPDCPGGDFRGGAASAKQR